MNQRQTIVFTRIPIDGDQRKRIQGLHAQPGYQLLKEIIGAHASEEQVKAMNAGLYAQISDIAREDVENAIRKAAEYSRALDILDEIEQKEEEWFTAKLEHRP
jgi:hypothetical protein